MEAAAKANRSVQNLFSWDTFIKDKAREHHGGLGVTINQDCNSGQIELVNHHKIEKNKKITVTTLVACPFKPCESTELIIVSFRGAITLKSKIAI